MATALNDASLRMIMTVGADPEDFREFMDAEQEDFRLPAPGELKVDDEWLRDVYAYAWSSMRLYPLLGSLSMIHLYCDDETAGSSLRALLTARPTEAYAAIDEEIDSLHAAGHIVTNPEKALAWARRREILECVSLCLESSDLDERLDDSDDCIRDSIEPYLHKAVDLHQDLSHAYSRGDWWGVCAD